MLTPEQLAKIRARADAATPGPWQVVRELDEYGAPLNLYYVDALGPYTYDLADAFFIAHARADVPALLDEIDFLRNALYLYMLEFEGKRASAAS